jgi:hypothetical protein
MGYPSYDDKSKDGPTVHYSAHVKIVRTLKERERAPITGVKTDKRDNLVLAEVSVQADTMEALTRKLSGHIALVDESGAE